MANPILTKSFIAGADTRPNRCVKFSDSGTVIEAVLAADRVVGVSKPQLTVASGDRVDVVLLGIADAIAGAAVTRGDLVTSDTTGAVITLAGATQEIGTALESGVAGDIIPVLLS